MPVKNLGKPTAFDGANRKGPTVDAGKVQQQAPAELKPTELKPTEQKPAEQSIEQPLFGDVGGTAGAAAAKKALGLGDAPTTKPQGAGARAAVAGFGLLERAGGKALRTGVLAALAGLQLFATAAGSMPQANSVTGRVPQTQTRSILDVRAMQVSPTAQQGQRALSDAQAVLSTWMAAQASDSSFTVTPARAQELILAAALPAKPADGQDLVAFARASLGTDTQALIGQLLDGNSLKVDDGARAQLSLAIGRAQAVSADGKITITGDQSGEKLRLTGVPGAEVEAVNLSTIPTKRLRPDETFIVGKVGADGKFEGDLAMKGGDEIRVRLKLPDGKNTEWVRFAAEGLGADTRNAEVALFRVGLTDKGNDQIELSNINGSRMISEPGATLRFVNERTQQHVDVKVNANGSFDAGVMLPGKPGDTFSVRASDGKNNTDFSAVAGSVKVAGGSGGGYSVNLPDPGLHADELDEAGKPKFQLERYWGPLVDAGGIQATDVTQGQIGNCYMPAAVAAIAHHRPGLLDEGMRVVLEDGTKYTLKEWQSANLDNELLKNATVEFRFFERTWQGGSNKFKEVWQPVDTDLFVRSWGGPLYGADDGPRGAGQMELWWSLMEKAYADWKGDYNTIGNGGHVSSVFRDLMGEEVDDIWISGHNGDQVWKQIVESVDAKNPIGAGTHGHDQDAIYSNTGVYSNHAYSILGYEEKDGVKYVELRNPWGESEPFPGDGKNDGIFKLKLDDFLKLYSSLYFVTGK